MAKLDQSPFAFGNRNVNSIILNKKTNFLKPLITGWFKALDRSTSTWTVNDAAYAYNERANVSLLAAGAWLIGWNALEEYRNVKRIDKSKNTKKHGLAETKKPSGRVDLFTCSREGDDAIFEAKQKYMTASSNIKTFNADVKKCMKSATDEAKREYNTGTKLGCCFFIPRFSHSRFKQYENESDTLIQEEIDRYLKCSTQVDIWAWYFAKECRGITLDEQSYYPGVLLGIKAVKLAKPA